MMDGVYRETSNVEYEESRLSHRSLANAVLLGLYSQRQLDIERGKAENSG